MNTPKRFYDGENYFEEGSVDLSPGGPIPPKLLLSLLDERKLFEDAGLLPPLSPERLRELYAEAGLTPPDANPTAPAESPKP